MDLFLDNPGQLKKELEEGLQRENTEGGLEDTELASLVEVIENPPRRVGPILPTGVTLLKGEGGSGEKVVSPPLPPIATSREENPEEGESELEEGGITGSLHGGDDHADEGDVEVKDRSLSSKGKTEAETDILDLQRFCEEQFGSMTQLIQSLTARVEKLERQTAPSIPLVTPLKMTMTGSPPRGGTHIRTKSGVGIPKAGVSLPTVRADVVERFLATNSKYPSLTAIRKAKLQSLQASMGLTPTGLDLKASDWSQEGIYTALVTAHEAGQ